jgi:polar amino acid transport system substrate-binding protein
MRSYFLKLPLTVIALVIGAVAAVTLFAQAPYAAAQNAAEGTVLKRVLDSGRIRCGYITYQPYAIKDPNTNALSGIMVEAVEAIGKKLGLKIDWVEEVGYATMFEGIDTGRYDMVCSGLWQNATRAKTTYFTMPLFYNAIRVWIRGDETRFQSLEDLNSPNIRIGVQDQAIEDIIAQQEFPKAQRIAIPQLNPWSDVLLNVTARKADVTFAELGVINPFLKKNPDALKELRTSRPLRVFATSLPIKMGANEFKSALDAAILEMLNEGILEAILKKYEKAPGELLRVAPLYQEPRP